MTPEEKTKRKQERLKDKKKTKMVSNIILAFSLTLISLLVIMGLSDFGAVGDQLSHLNGNYFLIVLALLLIYFFTYPLGLCFLAHKMYKDMRFIDSYLIGNTEHFFNGITPSATGGQPFQVYGYSERGHTAAEATAVITVNYIALLIVTNVLTIASLVYYPAFMANIPNFAAMAIIGFSLNFINLAFFICLGTCKWMKEILVKLATLACKIKFIGKHFSKRIPEFEAYCDNAQKGIRYVLSHGWTFTVTLIIKFVNLLIYYSIPFFIMLSLNVDLLTIQVSTTVSEAWNGWRNYAFTVLGTAFTLCSASWIPTPGSTGGMETAFKLIFGGYFGLLDTAEGSAQISGAMFVWRILTYYLILILSFITYLIFKRYSSHLRNKEIRQLEFETEAKEIAPAPSEAKKEPTPAAEEGKAPSNPDPPREEKAPENPEPPKKD
jgi:uncharacterized protein (TIRG00374 family)